VNSGGSNEVRSNQHCDDRAVPTYSTQTVELLSACLGPGAQVILNRAEAADASWQSPDPARSVGATADRCRRNENNATFATLLSEAVVRAVCHSDSMFVSGVLEAAPWKCENEESPASRRTT